MTSCVASAFSSYPSFPFLIPQYDVQYRFKSRQIVLCPFFSVMEPDSHDPDSPFRLVFVGRDSSGLIIHPLRGVLVHITKGYMIK
jgi:hypothetical protein